jgi:hypothetical protein
MSCLALFYVFARDDGNRAANLIDGQRRPRARDENLIEISGGGLAQQESAAEHAGSSDEVHDVLRQTSPNLRWRRSVAGGEENRVPTHRPPRSNMDCRRAGLRTDE